MRKIYAILGITFAVIAALLVFTNIFNTPPLSIVLSVILSIAFAMIGWQENKLIANFSILLSLASLGYLIYLFAALAL